MAQDRPKTANRRPKRPPRDPKRAPRGVPGGPQEAQIVDFHWFFSKFLAFWLFWLSDLPPRRRRPPRPPQNDSRGLQVSPKTAAKGLRTTIPGAGPGGSSAGRGGHPRAGRVIRSLGGPKTSLEASKKLRRRSKRAQDAAKTLQEASQRPPKRAPRGQNR